MYKTHGHSNIVSGFSNIQISLNDELYLGPFCGNQFYKIRVRSIHNDYRQEVPNLETHERGCISFAFKGKTKSEVEILSKQMRHGMVLSKNIPNTTNIIKAHISVFHNSITIKKGYVAFMNCGSIKESVKFVEIEDVVRGGDVAQVTLEFEKNYNYVESNSVFVFREGSMRGIGYVI